MRRAVSIYEASLGPEHPHVAVSLNNLALLLQATNRLSEAEPLIRRALVIDERSYGTDHPNVAFRLSILAVLLQETNRHPEAEPLMRRALAIREHALVPGHPHTLGSMQSFAIILEALGKTQEAGELRRRRLAILADQPDQPPQVLRSLALDAYNLGEYALAANLLERVLAAGFEPSSTHCHLARLALLQDDVSLAARHADAAWANRASAVPYVVPRILWLQLACALLAGETGGTRGAAATIGLLKTVLATEDAIQVWAMGPVIEHLTSHLSTTDTDFLRALVAAMSSPGHTAALDAFPLWRDTEPLPHI